MRKIIDRIKELNEVLPEVFLVDLLYLLAGELVIWFLVPNKQMCAVGFLMGVVYSIFSSVHMSFRIRKSFTVTRMNQRPCLLDILSVLQ